MDIKRILPSELKDENGQMNVMGGAVLAVVTAAILLMLGAYIMSSLATSLNDSGVTTMKTTLVTGFQSAASFPGLVIIFVFVGVILAVIGGLRQG